MHNEKHKRKARKIVGYKTVPTSKGSSGKVSVERTEPSRTPAMRMYKTDDERTNAPSYGKESTSKPAPDFVKDAQAKGKEIVEKDGKKYRAGVTNLKAGELNAGTSKLSVAGIKMPETKQVPIYEDFAKKKPSKLKPRRMVYGTVDKDGRGGNREVRRARPKK